MNKEACPLQNKCMNKDIVYKATISTSNTNDTKHYIGMPSNAFKERYSNHIKSFTHKKYSNETELSKHIWHLKQNKTDFTIEWSIIKNSISYTGGSKRCNLFTPPGNHARLKRFTNNGKISLMSRAIFSDTL